MSASSQVARNRQVKNAPRRHDWKWDQSWFAPMRPGPPALDTSPAVSRSYRMAPHGPTAGTPPVPRTEAELRAVSLQREELRSQLEQLSDQRNSLMGERHNAVVNQAPATVIAELDSRIKSLGDRVVRIEREKLAADDAVSKALANGVTTAEATAPAAPADLASSLLNQGLIAQTVAQAQDAMRVDYQRMMVGGGVGLVLLGVLAWRWAWNRASARLHHKIAAAGPAGNPHELKDAVDAIALEVERISENQRFVTKLLTEQAPAELVQRSDARPQ